MIEYAFLRDHLSGGPLVVLTLSLVVYALQVPTLIAFTVARFDDTSSRPATDALARLRLELGRHAPVAQLDRASVYGTEGREFESLRAR